MLTKNQIEFLNDVCTDRWMEENGIISFNGNVNMIYMNLTQIPVQFGKVKGHFDCRSNKITTLKGCPSIITDTFNCTSNQLTSLEDGPKEVMNFYSCERNLLTSLIGAPEICNIAFFCENNKLTSLEGCPKLIRGDLCCDVNPDLKYLWGIGRVEGNVWYDNKNEINEWIIKLAREYIIFPYFTLEENVNWIKREQKYSCLLGAPKEIKKYFSPRILNLVDSGVYNESKILDYKTFKRIC